MNLWHTLAWMMAALLCCMAERAVAQPAPAVRAQKAQAAYAQASALFEAGRYAEALPRGERALALLRAELGESHLQVALCLELLGRLHLRQGNPTRAEPLLLRGLTLREAALGPSHPELPTALSRLAQLYVTQGLYEQAQPLYSRALELTEATLGARHPAVAAVLSELASLHVAQGLYPQAQLHATRALEIREATLSAHHPDLLGSLVNLANLYTVQELYTQAEPLYLRALAIQEASLGKSHPELAVSLSSLGVLYMDQGQHAQAAPLLERALALREAALGEDHPLVASALINLAMSRRSQQRLDEAVPLLSRALASSERRLRREALEVPEWRLYGLLGLLRLDELRLYSLLREHPDSAAMGRLALSAALLRKGRSAAELADTSRAIYRGLGPREQQRFQKVRELRAQYAALSLQGPGILSPAEYQQRLATLDDEHTALEADLVKRSAPLRALALLPPPGEIVDRVAAALPKDGALVELIAYQDILLQPQAGASEAEQRLPVRYLALVLTPNAAIRTVDLGPAEPIDQAASHLRAALARRDASFQQPAQALHRLAFAPLVPLLGENRRVFLSPDGQLGLVPFAALHDGHQFLVDGFDFTYLTSGRELLPRPGGIPRSRSVVVLADPLFSAPRVPLPGTRHEAHAIQRLIPHAQLLLGRDATRERLLRLPTPGVLHLATHGFFLDDAPALEASRAVAQFGAMGERRPGPQLADPLLRSGLVLTPSSAPDTSLITALELAGLNLWGTELVVLSACDTGRGDALLGQGVYGLRRALVIAGAETVVMSLWKVNDDTTRQLMESYYRGLLQGQGRATALREAMRQLRATQPHPHYWAPFIALGRDAPLSVLSPPSSRHHAPRHGAKNFSAAPAF